MPRKPGDWVRTDRRDALTLTRLHRSGDLTPVWVPGPEQEAMRDLTRAREDIKARGRLGAFSLRHGRVCNTNKSRWTRAHFRWLEAQRFEQPVQHHVLERIAEHPVNRIDELLPLNVSGDLAQPREIAA